MSRRSLLGFLFAALALLCIGCATPVRPSGGPVDSTPPVVVEASPAEGATNVSADRLVLTFSERLDPASGSRALTITPEFATPPEVRVSGRRLTVLFPDTLAAEATYVVTLGTELRDEHGVALPRPITVAFATGATLDRGRISGRLRDPATGAGTAGLVVAAYPLSDTLGTALPDPRGAHPLVYRTEAATDGTFRLDYLREGPYFVVAFEDRNRNRQVDEGELFAAPPAPFVLARADTTRIAPLRPLDLFATALDTIPPQLRRVRALSNRRLALVFDEPVRLVDRTTAWTLADSATGQPRPLHAVYQTPDVPTQMLVLAEAPLTAPVRLTSQGAVADSSGNEVTLDRVVTPSTPADTVTTRFVDFLPPRRSPADSVLLLRPDARPGVRFSQPLDSTAFRTRVTVTGPSGALAYTTTTDDGVRYDLHLVDAPRIFRIEVAGADTTFVRRFAMPGPDALGALLGRVNAPDGAAVLLAAYPEQGLPFTTRAQADGAFALTNLPPGSYRLRLVLDANGNGRWDGGRLTPYEPPEPLRWLAEPVRVRARWETEVESNELLIGSSGD
ncbi:MAG: hypothetical protein HKN04_12830 [Rhodothermaceae bacterium]|nr:hypothetical protein [Rhodothermaceae bacterium]